MSWYAAYTRCNHEKTVRKFLQEKDITAFLPQIIVPSKRKDRKVLIKRPLFPNYLFIKLDQIHETWMKVFRTPGLVKICGNGRPMPIPNEDIESIKIFISSERNLYPLSYLKKGSKVQVISGPLCGAIGVLVKEDHKRRRLVVSIDLMGQSVAATLHDDEVRPY
jgi:transcription antitermination factor NusG